jgi:hypothetical protein
MRSLLRRIWAFPLAAGAWLARRWKWLGAITVASIARALLLLSLVLTGLALVVLLVLLHYPRSVVVDRRGPDELRFLDQGWSAAEREHYYYTPQGTSMKGLRYKWFTSLEVPWGDQRFTDPNHMRAYGFLVDPAASPANPDHLPVGFTRHFDRHLQEEVLDFTCATCHTGQLDVTRNGRRYGIRVDGGPAMHALTSVKLGHFGPVLLGAMGSTYLNPLKFDRFAHRVLGPSYTSRTRLKLRVDFRGVLLALVSQSVGDARRGLYPVEEGYGRTDALGRISNTVFGDELTAANYRVADAPVSYPYLWNIWKFDWVQYNASVSQPMARNMGEALGVGATVNLVDSYGRSLPAAERFSSSVLVENLHGIESNIQKLTPPRWPEDLLGKIDKAKAEQGRVLFETHCRGCHGPREADKPYTKMADPLRTDKDPFWRLDWFPMNEIGTDPGTAMNFVEHRLDLRPSGLTRQEVDGLVRPGLEEQLRRMLSVVDARIAELRKKTARTPAEQRELEAKEAGRKTAAAKGQATIEHQLASIDLSHVPVGAGLNYIGLALRKQHYAERRYTPSEQECLNGFGALDIPQVLPDYKARPLAGTWATGPFLHNGSVPTLYQLLSPVTERDQKFYVGGNDFDPVEVGILRTPRAGVNGFWYDTLLKGNSNVGHEFRAGYQQWKPGAVPQYGVIGPELSPDERWALVEYLKIHEDPATPPDRVPPTCTHSPSGSVVHGCGAGASTCGVGEGGRS